MRLFAIVLLSLELIACNESVLLLGRAEAEEGEPPEMPEEEEPTQEPVTRVAAGATHTCFVRAGIVACMGLNSFHALGHDDPQHVAASPEAVETGVASFVDVQAGMDFTCALREGGSIECFGANSRGQLGTGDTRARPELRPVSLRAPVVQFSGRFQHVCAILEDASLHCWGRNLEGELGQGDSYPGADLPSPVEVAPGTSFRKVSAGDGHTCGITTDDALFCWGRNSDAELGIGSDAPIQVRSPRRVDDGHWRDVSCGQHHTCAISEEGRLYCWGNDRDRDGHFGPAGLQGTDTFHEPQLVDDNDDWTGIEGRGFHTCGLRAEGDLWCWGRNVEGQLGLGHVDAIEGPQRMGAGFTQVSVGGFHTCALTTEGALGCMGKNEGQLGTGDLERRSRWTQVGEGVVTQTDQ